MIGVIAGYGLFLMQVGLHIVLESECLLGPLGCAGSMFCFAVAGALAEEA